MKPKNTFFVALLALITAFVMNFHQSQAICPKKLETKSEHALDSLYKNNKVADALSKKSVATLVFPDVRKLAFLLGGQTGDGILFEDGKVHSFYNYSSLSAGWQAGARKVSFALFFMDKDSLSSFVSSSGFNLGTQPSLTIIDQGFNGDMSTMNFDKGIKAFFFNPTGLMAGLDLNAGKFTKIEKSALTSCSHSHKKSKEAEHKAETTKK